MQKYREEHLRRLSKRYYWKKQKTTLRNAMREHSHSLLWVWEFSKKAVVICFIFYMIVQIYAMTAMVLLQDFNFLGELITQTAELVENCVFMYLVKAGVENMGKIFIGRETRKNGEDVMG